MSDKRRHWWLGCKPFLRHNADEKSILCTYCGKVNHYKIVEERPYVDYKPWVAGFRGWLFPISLLVIMATVLSFIFITARP